MLDALKSFVRGNHVTGAVYKRLGDWYWQRKWSALQRRRDRFTDQAALHYDEIDRAICFSLANVRHVVEGDVAMFGV
jgi:hypothetical protein